MTFEDIVSTVVNIIWSPVFVFICLAAGLLFSILTRFVQVRHFKEMIKLLFIDSKEQRVGISSFQAFAMTLSGRVGTGNIAGVATAIAFGGPGAIVWMWIIAFFGAGTAFVESTLAQIYKEKQGEEFRGGPAYYIKRGLGWKWLGAVFAICSVVGVGLFMPTVQSNTIATAFYNAFGIEPFVVGLGVMLLLGLVIIGGVKRIAHVAQVVAPVMAVIYVIVALIVLVVNYDRIPETFSLMLRSAFGLEAAFGGIVGNTIMWGVKRGVYSNEAGQGSGAIVAAAAKVSHPVKQGLVQSFSVYIDTLLVCTATAVMILSTGMYNVIDEATGTVIVENAPHLTETSVSYTQAAVSTVMPNIGSTFIALALLFFAFTTLMAYYYYAETGLAYLFGKPSKPGLWILRICLLLSTLYGSFNASTLAWKFGDLGVGMMAWINMFAVLLLFPKAIRTLRSYEKQKKDGKEPVFSPTELNIKNTSYWDNDDEK